VRGQDVFADEMDGLGPEAVEAAVFHQVAGRGDIVEQGVKPDVGHIFGIKWQGDAPTEAVARPGDTEVVQRLAQEAHDFVAA
jgi:hypothetical protein